MSLQLSYQVGLQGREFLGRPTRNRFDVHGSGFPSLLQVAFDRGSGHAKQFDDVSALVALIDGSQHSFSQILRIRFHWLPPIDACLLLVSPFILSLGSRLLPTAVGTVLTAYSHALPFGPLGSTCFFISALWIELVWRKHPDGEKN